jgi:hypothetical protein
MGRCRFIWTVVGTAVVTGSGCGGGVAPNSVAPGGDPLAVQVPAGDVGRLDVDGRDGRLDVRVGRDDVVRARVSLGAGCDAVGGYALTTTRSGNGLHMRVQPSTKDSCDEIWTVEVPMRLAVSGDLDRADIAITGPGGGVSVHLGNGTVRISVPSGDLRAKVEKGDVIAQSGTRSLGDVDVHSEVGEVEVSIDGGTLRHERPHGPGDRFAIDGSGNDRISLQATVGNVRLGIR